MEAMWEGRFTADLPDTRWDGFSDEFAASVTRTEAVRERLLFEDVVAVPELRGASRGMEEIRWRRRSMECTEVVR
ncbi:MAG: hypothetical protein C4547_05360 [Phycisphaerales bacterium]|nr:MAG: hypothetical protein C4547_05360 [Phycisphaerales bacterium]